MKEKILKIFIILGILIALVAVYYIYNDNKDICVELCRGKLYVPGEGFVGGGCYKDCSLSRFNLPANRVIMLLIGSALSFFSFKKLRSNFNEKAH